jgi:hypothetical protein
MNERKKKYLIVAQMVPNTITSDDEVCVTLVGFCGHTQGHKHTDTH